MNSKGKLCWMRDWTKWAASLILATVVVVSPVAAQVAPLAPEPADGKIVVADRSSGTATVISTHMDTVVATLALPPGDNPPEPMYVYYTPIRNRFFVGDRANDRVVAFNARTLEVVATAPAGAGVFHMWGNTVNKQLWVNNDIDNTSTVIDLRTLETIATVPTPADLVAAGGKPHDVILAPNGVFAYVTVLGLGGPNDYVVQYSTQTFAETGRAPVGKDPHVSLTPRNQLLYVPCQNTNSLNILDRWTLDTVDVLDIPGAHGAGMPVNGGFFYTTNLPGGGVDALWTVDTRTNMLVGDPVDAPYTVPHNIALTPGGRKLYLTHSGFTNDKVTIYRIGPNDPVPMLIGEVTTGMNPFGLAWVP
jgi:DNA-binding beta-propeller fold protein YncE